MSGAWASATSQPASWPVGSSGASRLSRRQRTHLRWLTNWWSLLADLSFSDLLLFVRDPQPPNSTQDRPPEDRFVIADQARAATGRTLYRDDHVGLSVSRRARPYVALAFETGEIQEGEVRLVPNGALAHVTSIPVICDDEVIAVLSREVAPDFEQRRDLGSLETTYLSVFRRLADLVAAGRFPHSAEPSAGDRAEPPTAPPDGTAGAAELATWDTGEVPRIGDGLMVVSLQGTIEFASPNAVSSLHRAGVRGDVEGKTLHEAGLTASLLGAWQTSSAPVSTEIEHADATVGVTILRLDDDPHSRAALVLLRDVTALRLRDRLLLSKDRTIAEVHHRVKNNLQTISSLLRLQARRLREPASRGALEESIRRIGAIALVHEALAGSSSEQADVCGVAKMLVDVMADSVAAAGHNLSFSIRCNAPTVASDVMTPLAVVINELLQNAIDHGYPELWEGSGEGNIDVVIELDVGDGDVDQMLRLEVSDNGVGVAADFDPATDPGLGTTIIRALTSADLGGEFTVAPRADGPGTVAVVRVPLRGE